jgi:hypothetical protein
MLVPLLRIVWGIYFLGLASISIVVLANAIFNQNFKPLRDVLYIFLWPIAILTAKGRKRLTKLIGLVTK